MNVRWYHVVILLIAARALTAGYRSFRKEEPSYSRPPETVEQFLDQYTGPGGAALEEPGKLLQLELNASPPAEPVGKAATDWVVGAWELYAMSNTHAGPKMYDLRGELAASFCFDSDGTYSGHLRTPDVTMRRSGTWTLQGNRYTLSEKDPFSKEPQTICQEGKNLYQIIGDDEGNEAWLWFRPIASLHGGKMTLEDYGRLLEE
ncbi:MAG: lipocalin family protein [Armatimonadetes bacterium]|nr:lipocalin family protein [Armatimonadota bacterium]